MSYGRMTIPSQFLKNNVFAFVEDVSPTTRVVAAGATTCDGPSASRAQVDRFDVSFSAEKATGRGQRGAAG